MSRLLCSLTAALALTAVSAVPAAACDTCRYQTVVCYERVTEYVTKCVPYTYCVIFYDACGQPYKVTRTGYKEVRVPVTKTVAVTKIVKVCD